MLIKFSDNSLCPGRQLMNCPPFFVACTRFVKKKQGSRKVKPSEAFSFFLLNQLVLSKELTSGFVQCMKINYTWSKGVSVKHIGFETATHLHHKETEDRNSCIVDGKAVRK